MLVRPGTPVSDQEAFQSCFFASFFDIVYHGQSLGGFGSLRWSLITHAHDFAARGRTKSCNESTSWTISPVCVFKTCLCSFKVGDTFSTSVVEKHCALIYQLPRTKNEVTELQKHTPQRRHIGGMLHVKSARVRFFLGETLNRACIFKCSNGVPGLSKIFEYIKEYRNCVHVTPHGHQSRTCPTVSQFALTSN